MRDVHSDIDGPDTVKRRARAPTPCLPLTANSAPPRPCAASRAATSREAPTRSRSSEPSATRGPHVCHACSNRGFHRAHARLGLELDARLDHAAVAPRPRGADLREDVLLPRHEPIVAAREPADLHQRRLGQHEDAGDQRRRRDLGADEQQASPSCRSRWPADRRRRTSAAAGSSSAARTRPARHRAASPAIHNSNAAHGRKRDSFDNASTSGRQPHSSNNTKSAAMIWRTRMSGGRDDTPHRGEHRPDESPIDARAAGEPRATIPSVPRSVVPASRVYIRVTRAAGAALGDEFTRQAMKTD